ncbi:MAG: shikimate kinase [Gammaproteobacteria bacterium]|nr:shikimate kinase [Gammaproteobacteria bacterium]
MQNHIYLIGLMAAGKSTVGRNLARLLRREFIDIDAAIEEKTGVTVSHIFEIEGEPGFRKREAKLLAEVAGANVAANGGGAVVATGGGIVLREDNRELMRASGAVVYLRAARELLLERLKRARADARPLLQDDPEGVITRLLAERGPIYAAAADITVDVRAATPLGTARKIAAELQNLEQKSPQKPSEKSPKKP